MTSMILIYVFFICGRMLNELYCTEGEEATLKSVLKMLKDRCKWKYLGSSKVLTKLGFRWGKKLLI